MSYNRGVMGSASKQSYGLSPTLGINKRKEFENKRKEFENKRKEFENERKEFEMVVLSVTSGNSFLAKMEKLQDRDFFNVEIKGLSPLDSKEKLESLIWSRKVVVKAEYFNEKGYMVSDVFIDNEDIKTALA